LSLICHEQGEQRPRVSNVVLFPRTPMGDGEGRGEFEISPQE